MSEEMITVAFVADVDPRQLLEHDREIARLLEPFDAKLMSITNWPTSREWQYRFAASKLDDIATIVERRAYRLRWPPDLDRSAK